MCEFFTEYFIYFELKLYINEIIMQFDAIDYIRDSLLSTECSYMVKFPFEEWDRNKVFIECESLMKFSHEENNKIPG